MDSSKKYSILAVAILILAALVIFYYSQKIATPPSTVAAALSNEQTAQPSVGKQKPAPRVVKGLYLTANSAGNEKKMSEIIALIEATELNAVVIDIKDYSGRVFLAGARTVIDRLHEKDIYVIARQTVFQDPLLAQTKPEWAIRSAAGGWWRDDKGLAWVDPTRQEVWEYNLAIAKEAIELGFDEINFDYVRFPSDGNLKTAIYSMGAKPEYEVMGEFFQYLNTALSAEPAWISLDVFGFVLERDDGLRVGQRLADMVGQVDYISPMMYPSHYPAGHLGLANPAAHPGAVIDHGLKLGVPRFIDQRAQLRPWLQAFNLGAVYDGAKIRAQIEAVEKYPNTGWLLWNAANRYTADGLKLETGN